QLRHRARAPDPLAAERRGGRQPPRRSAPAGGGQGRGPLVGSSLRHPRRRDQGGARRLAPSTGVASRGRTGSTHPRRGGGQRGGRGARAPVSPTWRTVALLAAAGLSALWLPVTVAAGLLAVAALAFAVDTWSIRRPPRVDRTLPGELV